jgi:predicted nucleotidyltransferase
LDYYLEIKTSAPLSDEDFGARQKKLEYAVNKIKIDLMRYSPKAVLLFGSAARFLLGQACDKLPNDIDLIMVGNNFPFALKSKDYNYNIEFHFFKINQMVDIAKILRYDPKFIALSRLYGRNVIKHHARDVIAASLLLGPSYNDFGIQQIEIDGITDKRDYSVHKVLYGKVWWSRLTEYARERQGPVKKLSDKMINRFEFDQWAKIRYKRYNIK